MSVSSLDSGLSDIVVIGGGIAGATIALVVARAGFTVTLLEQQLSYRDRVRGEYLQPWGVAEAQHLGISEILGRAGGFFARRIIPYDEINAPHAAEAAARALDTLVPGIPGALCVSHPAACLALSQAAENAGTTVIRGIGGSTITPGSEPAVTFELDGVEHRLSCRLIIGADGRSSTVRAQAGIRLLHEEPTHLISGMLVDHAPEWTQEDIAIGTEGEVHFFVFPQGGQRLRLYTCTALDQHRAARRPCGSPELEPRPRRGGSGRAFLNRVSPRYSMEGTNSSAWRTPIYIRTSGKSIQTRPLDYNDGAAHRVAPVKKPGRELRNESCRQVSPSQARDACGPQGVSQGATENTTVVKGYWKIWWAADWI